MLATRDAQQYSRCAKIFQAFTLRGQLSSPAGYCQLALSFERHHTIVCSEKGSEEVGSSAARVGVRLNEKESSQMIQWT